MSAVRVLANAIVNHPFKRPSPLDVANHAVEALHAAGYRILAPGELDRETVERCEEVADKYPMRDPAEDGNGYWAAEEIAAAIRTLTDGGHDA